MFTIGLRKKLKKTNPTVENSYDVLEMDELYWFVFHKPNTETRENVYLTTLVSRNPRQIVGFDIAYDKAPERIQGIIDSSPPANIYYTDGYLGYIDIVYPGKHSRNINNKNDTYTVEGVNADLRHYIPTLARRSRCFARTVESLIATVKVFVGAYNRFGLAKQHFRKHRSEGEFPLGVVDFL